METFHFNADRDRGSPFELSKARAFPKFPYTGGDGWSAIQPDTKPINV